MGVRARACASTGTGTLPGGHPGPWPQAIINSGLDVERFISVGVVSGLRQLLEFGLFHGDPHPGNVFAMRDGRIAYVDFGNVAEVSQANKQVPPPPCKNFRPLFLQK